MNYLAYESRNLKMVSEILDKALSDIINKKNQKVLDIGCGIGLSLYELVSYKNKDIDVNGYGLYYIQYTKKDNETIKNMMSKIKKDPNLIHHLFNTKSKLTNKKSINLIEHNVNIGLPFEDLFFDLIYSNNTFHYLEEKLFVLEEINRVLKPNGIAIIQIDRTDNKFWGEQNLPRLRIHEKNNYLEIESILKNYNFDITIKPKSDYFILTLRKSKNRNLPFLLNKEKSINLSPIRQKGYLTKEEEYKLQILNNYFKSIKTEAFGGYISVY